MTAVAVAVFWARIKPAAVDACWPWPGGRRAGYGLVQIAGQRYLAHRLAYEAAHGPIPSGLEVEHLCHNRDVTCSGGTTCLHRACCNPAHLEAITHAENTRRMIKFHMAHKDNADRGPCSRCDDVVPTYDPKAPYRRIAD